MTKADIFTLLANMPDDAMVFIDISAWDEPLNLAEIDEGHGYHSGAPGEKPFATLRPSKVGATRLDPNAV